MKFTIKNGMKARYKLTVRDKELNVLRESSWSDNVLTDHFFAVMGGGGPIYFRGMVVGVGNAQALPTDTELDSYLAAASSRASTTVESQSTVSPRYIKRTVVDRFNAGFVGSNPANISEVGMVVQSSSSPAPGPSSPLGSRSLVVDSMGAPTAVPVGVDEILDVTWEWVTFVPEDVITGSIPLDNKGSPEVRQATCRGFGMFQSGTWAGALPVPGNTSSSNAFGSQSQSGTSSGASRQSNSLLGYADQSVSSSDVFDITERVSYSPETLTVSLRSSAGIARSNFPGGIGLFITPPMLGGRWQFSFDTNIPKTSDDRLEIDWDVVFERL